MCLLLLGYPSDALEQSGLRQAVGDDPVVFIRGGHVAEGEEQSPLDGEAAQRALAAAGGRGHQDHVLQPVGA